MIVVDTNVLSELMRPVPSTRVLRWLRARPAAELHTTAITQTEVLGLRLLPKARRRDALEGASGAMFAEEFADWILEFGPDAAPAYARITSERRNASNFAGCGIEVLDPWA